MTEEGEKFAYFSVLDDGSIQFHNNDVNSAVLVLPRHPETNDLDTYYLQSMLKYFDPAKDVSESEILDAFPIISQTKDTDNRFYKLSIYRLREFYKDRIEEDEYIQASIKHLFMYTQLVNSPKKILKRICQGCMDRVTPVMYQRDERDTVDSESYQLDCLASYVPTKTFRIMKLLKGWIEGALHFYDYSIMFFDYRFLGFDGFNENIIDLKTKDLLKFKGRQTGEHFAELTIQAPSYFVSDFNGLYYETELRMDNITRKWLFTLPNNDNERDGKVMMFRNKDLKVRFEQILIGLFPIGTFRLNDVFKWNRYANGGKFSSHYDTMFVQNSTGECSLYSLLIYIEVEGDSFLYLMGEKEHRVRLESQKAYIIPHWVKHRVEGQGMREFIKTEVVFNNTLIGTSCDKELVDAFDTSCYYMLQSIRHPELKDIVSRNFNTINEARFYKTVFVPKLINNIFFVKSIIRIPIDYCTHTSNELLRTVDVKLHYITNGTYYYFKTKTKMDGNKPVVSRNEAIVMLCTMQLDIQPKKMVKRIVRECQCSHPCVEYRCLHSDLALLEKIAYWGMEGLESKIADNLQYMQYPSLDKIQRVGNISVSDIPDDPDTFYFAACQNIHPTREYTEGLITELTSNDRGNYKRLDVEFVGPEKNIVKIRQHSFKNGIRITHRWLPQGN